MLASEMITELSRLDDLRVEWDEMASERGLPMMSHGCVTAWWRRLAPATAQARVAVVREGGRLVGLAPFYVDPAAPAKRFDYRLPGIELAARLEPLARAGREREVAGELARLLCSARPRADLIALEGMPAGSIWATALRDRWPTRPRPLACRYQVLGSPTVALGGSFEEWLAGKSSNFRSQMRRLRRQFAAAGGTARMSAPETLHSDVDAFMRLHAARWQGRGDSTVVSLGERGRAMLGDIGERSSSAERRLLLQLLEIEGEPICAQLFLAVGGYVLYVNGGWDERFAKLKPPMLALLQAIEEGFERGERLLDLGVGVQPYKLRFADAEDPVAWTVLLPIGGRLPQTCLRVAPMLGGNALRNALKRHISKERLEGLRELRTRLRGSHRTR